MTEKAFSGTAVTVYFDGSVCQHAAECHRGLPAVFDTKQRPWVQPDNASPEEVLAQVARCPSGALRAELTQAANSGDGQA